MEGITEVFTSFLPRVTVIETNTEGGITAKKKFSAGSLVAMVVYLVLGVGIGALI